MPQVRNCSGLAAALMALAVLTAPAFGQPVPGGAVLVEIKDAIGPATKDHFLRALERAEDSDARLLVLQLDTPGGLDAAMRDMIQGILASDVPVVTYVAPSGARAASAGTFILYASHVAAMAPGTNVGAATPVPIGGSPPSDEKDRARDGKDDRKDDQKDEDGDAEAQPAPGSASDRKAVNDAIAYIRSLADLRGRDPKFAEAAVRETLEEVNLKVRLTGILDAYSFPGQPIVVIVYAADVVGGEFKAFDCDPLRACLSASSIHDTLAALACHGLFERHPRLRVAAIESGSDWVAPLLRKLKKAYGQMPFRFRHDPVEQIQRHVWVSPYYEDDLEALKAAIGADHILFGSDWPHAEGLAVPTDFIHDLKGYDAGEVQLVMRDNARALLAPPA